MGGFGGSEFDLRAPWGKAGSGDVPHPLICHAIDTMAVAELLFAKLFSQWMRARLTAAFAPIGDACAWTAFLSGLHDLGKLSPAFQARRRDLASRLMGEPAASMLLEMPDNKELGQRVDTPHGVLTALHVERILKRWGALQRTAQDVAYALGGHHGFFPRSASVSEARKKKRDHGERIWEGWCDDFVHLLIGLRGLQLPPEEAWGQVRLDLGLLVALSGLTSASDWIASDMQNFPYKGAAVDLDAYVAEARDRAEVAVERLGWLPWQPPEDASFIGLFKTGPRPVQVAVEALGHVFEAPTLLIVEAPTGEGKTKAALQAAAQMSRSAGVAGDGLGLYFAAPTKATSNQAYREIRKMLEFHQADLAVRLLHGSASEFLAAEASTHGARGVVRPVCVGQDEGGSTESDAREWFTGNKGLLAPVGAGTWDQVLMAGIRSKHVFVRLAGVSGKVVVIDEVHALDTYMSTLLDRVLGWLGLLGVSVILLSATLPAHRRLQLVANWRAGLGSNEGDIPYRQTSTYPRITYATAEEVETFPVAVSDLNADRSMKLVTVADEELMDWLLGKVSEGGCLAVVHNLVRRVEGTCAKLEEAIEKLPAQERPELFVITGQMADRARYEVEEKLRERFGPPEEGESCNPRRPVRAIVVGTQVLESSLDLDFDGLVSDLAPIDSLIQRMGRVQRHGAVHRRFPHLAELTLAITGVAESATGPVLPAYTGAVYPRALTWHTWALLRDRRHIHSPTEVSDLVEQVYGDNPVSYPPGWKGGETADEQLDRRTDSQSADVRVIYLPPPEPDRSLKDMTVRATYSGRTRSRSGPHERN
ncbi:CRISPR-associated helicase Cas3' [Sphaerisporangium sp. NPDC051011]|uniref:CRISPR-associated helicase Cas3' n=1 Tax=Sphaerisporangium sp. NPDC051011 TaxID=3155792 RepID=UPI0033D2098B